MLPGFVDLQVNGYRGIDFCSELLTLNQINQVSEVLLARGTIAYCPTMISSSLEIYERNLPLIIQASKSLHGAQILGVHLEGPFINPEKGAVGVHPKQHVIKPSIDLFERFRELTEDKISILTLAPELEGAEKLIQHIHSKCNTIVSLGHHLANAELIHKAAKAGAKTCTHIGNGLPEMIHRHLNPIWPSLANKQLTIMIISDGFHLPRDLLQVILRSKKVEQIIVTSDLVHFAGMSPGEYQFYGTTVILEENGHLHVKDAYQLSGSACDMLRCMNTLASIQEITEEELTLVGYSNALSILNAKIDQERMKNAPYVTFDGEKYILNI